MDFSFKKLGWQVWNKLLNMKQMYCAIYSYTTKKLERLSQQAAVKPRHIYEVVLFRHGRRDDTELRPLKEGKR